MFFEPGPAGGGGAFQNHLSPIPTKSLAGKGPRPRGDGKPPRSHRSTDPARGRTAQRRRAATTHGTLTRDAGTGDTRKRRGGASWGAEEKALLWGSTPPLDSQGHSTLWDTCPSAIPDSGAAIRGSLNMRSNVMTLMGSVGPRRQLVLAGKPMTTSVSEIN